MWHAKTVTSVAESAKVIVAPKPRGAFKCCYCKFRGHSSVAIRQHAATAHSGLPVKMITPPRPMTNYRSPVPDLTAVRSEPVESPPELSPAKHEETVARQHSVRSVDPRPVGNNGGGRLHCSRCRYFAPSAKILNIHWSNLHQSDSENEGADAAHGGSASPTTLDVVDDLAEPSTSKAAFKLAPSPKTNQSKLISSGATSGLGSKSSTAPRKCSRCLAERDTKSHLPCHPSKTRHSRALGVYRGKAFTSRKLAHNHCAKHHPASVSKYKSTVMDSPRATDVVDAGAAKERVPSVSGQTLDGFSWYGREREPVHLDAVHVHAVVPGSGKPQRLTAATFLSVQGQRPALRITDFTKLL